MMRALYSLLMVAAQPLLRRKLRRRGAAEPGYLEAVEERFGRYVSDVEPGALWIHAVSLGETRAAAILIGALRQLRPGVRVLLTHGTATGRAEGEKLLRPGDLQAWLPWDTPAGVEAFLRHFRPQLGVLVETEIWPNLVAHCSAQGVPLVLANARLSEKSLRPTQRLAWLSRPAYAALAAVWAQTQADAQRLVRAGARVSGVMGNLKFDAQPDEGQLAKAKAWRAGQQRPVVMLASSREGEEAEFFQLLKQKQAPVHAGRAQGAIASIANQVQWLVVPRHPQRFDAVAALAIEAGFTVARRSAWVQGPTEAEVWIGDSLGEMALYYGLADVALLGGSFAPLGGQNLIEAAACGCPVVMGPHTFNFSEAAQLAQEAGAAVRVASLEEGVDQALAIAGDPGRREVLCVAGLRFAAAHRGAAEKTANAVLALVASRAAH